MPLIRDSHDLGDLVRDISFMDFSSAYPENRSPIETEEEKLSFGDKYKYGFCIGDVWVNRDTNECWFMFGRHYNLYHWVPVQEAFKIKDYKGLKRYGYCKCKRVKSRARDRKDKS